MNYKLFILCVVCLLSSLGLRAEDSIPSQRNIMMDMPDVEVIQDAALMRLLHAAVEDKRELVEMDGYRVQIFSSNQQQAAKAEALKLENQLKDKLSQAVYVLYLPPFWKVRVGDFRTYDEAKEYKRIIVEEFPALMGNTYIVRDRIQALK